MGEPIYPLSVTYGRKLYLLHYLPMYRFTPQRCPIRWCAHLWGRRWGVRGFYLDLRPSQAVDRRRTLYNTAVHGLYNVQYLIRTHLIGPNGVLGGLVPPLVQKKDNKPF